MSLSREAMSALMNTGAQVAFDEPMSRHTSFQIGGNADAFVCPSDTKQIKAVTDICTMLEVPFFILGNGTNLLVSDEGVRGVVIHIGKNMGKIEIDGDVMYAGAGALLSSAAGAAMKSSLSGLELLGGIPGTVGGAVYMNAGAYGAQISDLLAESSYVDRDGNAGVYAADEHCFGYRRSIYTDSDKVVTGAVFKLRRKSTDEIKSLMGEYAKRRRDKQPLAFPSAGSVFKRPEGHFAGALIEQAGLKGFSIGGAQVSEKHAGFIINTGGATAADVMHLIEHIKDTVYKKDGVMLECEIKMLGKFS